MNLTATLFKKIKNRSHDTIYVFKNYFITVFLILTKINYIQTQPQYILTTFKLNAVEVSK